MDMPDETDQPQRSQPLEFDDLNARMDTAAPAMAENDITNVPVDRLETAGINSPSDFDSMEQYQGMLRESQMLQQMQPAIAQGATEDVFDDWDRANQIGSFSPQGYTRGYGDAYRSYYSGAEPIVAEQNPDGTYNILNGHHRIFVAKQAGLDYIPVKIVG